MLPNTRGRTVFACQPKRLPQDVDKLSFYRDTIVRKKSVTRLTVDMPSAISPTSVPTAKVSAVLQGGSPSLRRSASLPFNAPPRSSTTAPALAPPPPPPPLPSFPDSWKPEPSMALRPVSAGGSPIADGSALRPVPRGARERTPFAVKPTPPSPAPKLKDVNPGPAFSSPLAPRTIALRSLPSTPSPTKAPTAAALAAATSSAEPLRPRTAPAPLLSACDDDEAGDRPRRASNASAFSQPPSPAAAAAQMLLLSALG
eukprot:TRINITY_DN28981_c0_g1_i1.p1 TRINITY_DN28981_c0_g1~~TRINITY_DN28981_c0_g1_i1.p1  ORF type:complete len:257 (-),score=48.62 TRINITY_DN28981_c0_g1_i1:167-937(-)